MFLPGRSAPSRRPAVSPIMRPGAADPPMIGRPVREGSRAMRLIPAGRAPWPRPLAALVATAATLCAGLAGCERQERRPDGPPPPTVTVVAARKSDVPVVVHSQGTTRALNDVTIRARVKGFLEKAHFSEGT